MKKYYIFKLIFFEWDVILVKWKFGMEWIKKKFFKMLVYIFSVILVGNLIFIYYFLEFKGFLVERLSEKNFWVCMIFIVGLVGFLVFGLK